MIENFGYMQRYGLHFVVAAKALGAYYKAVSPRLQAIFDHLDSFPFGKSATLRPSMANCALERRELLHAGGGQDRDRAMAQVLQHRQVAFVSGLPKRFNAAEN
jgi:hypothetical protein